LILPPLHFLSAANGANATRGGGNGNRAKAMIDLAAAAFFKCREWRKRHARRRYWQQGESND
jgi:hypothetical protein